MTHIRSATSDSLKIDDTVPEDQIVAGNTSHTRPENRAFYPALDGLRAVAFLMVFFDHYCFVPWAWAGVDVFFVLSGFLITGILFDSRHDPHRVRNFYVRRTLRIFPLYYGVMLLILPFVYRQLSWPWLIWPLYLGNYAHFFAYIPFFAAAVPGYQLQHLADFSPAIRITFRETNWYPLYLAPFWSLCVEEQFYLLWPSIVFWVRDRRKLLWICAASLPVCVAARLVGQHVLPVSMLEGWILYLATPFRLDALLLGGCIALWIRGPHANLLLRSVRYLSPIVVAILLLLAAFALGSFWHAEYRYPGWQFTWGLLMIDLFAALILVLAIQPTTLLFRALNLRPLRWLGRISYGAYVLHSIPHTLYNHVAFLIAPKHMYGVSATIALTSTCLLAWLSYRFFEIRFLNLKERWTIRTVSNHA